MANRCGLIDSLAWAIESFCRTRQGSSAVEQGTHKPLVGSSILPPGNTLCLGFTYFVDRRADITSARL
jgi:hypothetical protein